jgi:hypothetical protein
LLFEKKREGGGGFGDGGQGGDGGGGQGKVAKEQIAIAKEKRKALAGGQERRKQRSIAIRAEVVASCKARRGLI